MTRVLVTGGGGFVGEAACRAFHASGHDVLAVDRAPAEGPAPWTHQVADLSDAVSACRTVADAAADVVVHAAGTASVVASMENPGRDFDGSVLLLKNVLEGCARAGRTTRVIYMSSAAVYGNPSIIPTPETAPTLPISPYGHHKLMCEQLAASYALAYPRMAILGARVFSLVGPRQRRLLAWELAQQVLSGVDEVVLQGTGDETRDYLHVDDLAGALVALVRADGWTGARVLNVASGTETSTRRLAEHIVQAAGKDIPVRALGKARPGDPVRWRAACAWSVVTMGVDEALRTCLRAWTAGGGEGTTG